MRVLLVGGEQRGVIVFGNSLKMETGNLKLKTGGTMQHDRKSECAGGGGGRRRQSQYIGDKHSIQDMPARRQWQLPPLYCFYAIFVFLIEF